MLTAWQHPAAVSSPSLRGSGLKLSGYLFYDMTVQVSLFTREWIEIYTFSGGGDENRTSPSLRGSGLKCCLSAESGFF